MFTSFLSVMECFDAVGAVAVAPVSFFVSKRGAALELFLASGDEAFFYASKGGTGVGGTGVGVSFAIFLF